MQKSYLNPACVAVLDKMISGEEVEPKTAIRTAQASSVGCPIASNFIGSNSLNEISMSLFKEKTKPDVLTMATDVSSKTVKSLDKLSSSAIISESAPTDETKSTNIIVQGINAINDRIYGIVKGIISNKFPKYVDKLTSFFYNNNEEVNQYRIPGTNMHLIVALSIGAVGALITVASAKIIRTVKKLKNEKNTLETFQNIEVCALTLNEMASGIVGLDNALTEAIDNNPKNATETLIINAKVSAADVLSYVKEVETQPMGESRIKKFFKKLFSLKAIYATGLLFLMFGLAAINSKTLFQNTKPKEKPTTVVKKI